MTEPSPVHPELPPIPDLRSGHPRPPRAPRESAANARTPADRRPRKPPSPPPVEFGITLEWSQPTVRQIVFGISAIMGFFVLAVTAMWSGFGWVDSMAIWIILALLFAAFLSIMIVDWNAAGAMWVQERAEWVNTYELTRIRFDVHGYNRVLKLEDASGRKIRSLKLRGVQPNPAMWDLVYNGILHSVASGNCEISDKTRSVLKLPLELGR